ncbi:Flp family type IVb pilin [Phenylobacterium sp.]|uniref:Flp family type IVb pilin n=1 Tax=Phenylobacterium sp. TaxID=1871053 RepID=UPI001829C836|nr:Flp family type IVb pilin [Phenylobacterium sp.]MBA4794036.1 Flp family type IVb pilin [Phenylobacterium sp.]MBC7167081.1 Flp family type IVb pilin [Phenylobacterium sp.]
MGEARQADRLSDAAGRRAAGRLAARPDLSAFRRDDRGATAIEYALLAAVLGLVVVTAAGALRAEIYDLLIFVSDSLG